MDAILREAKKSFLLNAFAWRHKISGISEGFVSRDTLWDRLVYDAARANVIGEGAGTVRAVIVGGGPSFFSLLPWTEMVTKYAQVCYLRISSPLLE